jgi:hypothetical protein
MKFGRGQFGYRQGFGKLKELRDGGREYKSSMAVFFNRPAPGVNYTVPREILLELVTNLNVILYLSTCHIVYIIALITLYDYAVINY